MSTSLCFNEVQFSPVNHDNQIWIRSGELARALGYRDEKAINKMYARNEDEFNSGMSQVIDISEGVNLTPIKFRVFSLRGCHLIAMFARTAVAKAFRKWVLDVLDKLAVEAPAVQPALPDTSPLTQSSRAELKAIVDAKLSTYPSDIQGKARSEIWTRFNRHFKIAEYAQLPMCQMPDARDYLVEMKPKALATIEAKAEAAQLPALSKKDLPSTARLFEDIRKAEKILEGTENWTHIKVRLELCREVDLYTFERSVDMHINAAWYALGLAKSSLLAALTVGRISKEFTPNGTARA